MNDTDGIGSNQSGNPQLADLIAARFSRRKALSGGLATAAAGFLGGCADGTLNESVATANSALHGKKLLGFAEVPPSSDDTVRVPDGYTWDVPIPWGTPLFPNSPPFAEDASNGAADQELQVGFNHDGMHYFPIGSGRS